MTGDLDLDRAASKRKILNRLKRASGQLVAVIDAVEADADCRHVVTQLAAVSSAVDRAGFAIVACRMKECLRSEDAELPADVESLEDLEQLFLMLA